MTYVTRAKTAIRQVKRHDAVDPTNAQLAELGQAALYYPAARPLWSQLLEQHGYIINPSNPTVLDDIGTETGTAQPPVFNPASNAEKNAMIAALFLRLTRRTWRQWIIDYREKTSNAPAVPLNEVRGAIQTQAISDSVPLVGEDIDDPES